MTTAVESDIKAFSEMPAEMPAAEAPKKKLKSKSPTARCLDECRRVGWTAGVVEKFVRFPAPGHRVDLFGVIDIVAMTTYAIIGIQASPGSRHAAHRDKILAEPRARTWIGSGGQLQLWSWSQRGDVGKRKRWTLRVEEFSLDSPWTEQVMEPHGSLR